MERVMTMNRCPSCGATLKRKQSHCSQCGTRVETQSGTSNNRIKWGVSIATLLLLIGVGSWLWFDLNEPVQTRETKTAKDVQQSFTASTESEETAETPISEEDATLPDTEVETGTFYDPKSASDIDSFMNAFVGAFTEATYYEDASGVESFLLPGSAFEANTLDYLENTLFAKNITEDQLETTVTSVQVEGEERDTVEDGETARVTTRETYRIAKEDSVVIASFETTYAVLYQDGELKISQNIASKELSREEE